MRGRGKIWGGGRGRACVGAGRCRHGFSSVHRDHTGCTERGGVLQCPSQGPQRRTEKGEGGVQLFKMQKKGHLCATRMEGF